MDERTRVARVLRGLRELGVAELFLDGLTAEEAERLLAGGGPDRDRDRESRSPRSTARGARTKAPRSRIEPAASGAAEAESFPGPPREAGAGPAGGVSSAGGAGGGAEALRVLGAEATGCVKCGLSESRTQVVFGRGSPSAELVVVGEAPGSEEDRTGLPFVGPAGKLLDLLLLSVGFDRESVYICNVLKCRPPSNRDPRPDEVATCAPYLHGQLDAIRPSVLLAVGKFAAQMLTGTEQSIGRLRGRVHEYRGIPVVATYHPAYLLRSPHATRKSWQDLQLMRQVMDEQS